MGDLARESVPLEGSWRPGDDVTLLGWDFNAGVASLSDSAGFDGMGTRPSGEDVGLFGSAPDTGVAPPVGLASSNNGTSGV